MVRRGAALWAAVLLAALLVPAAAGQAPTLPAVADRHRVLSLLVPLDADGTGSMQVPVAGGVLDIDLIPVLLEAAGSGSQVEAYIAEATLVLPDGLSLPLPSMVILDEAMPASDALAASLADLAMQAEDLRDAILGLQADPADDVLGAADELRRQAETLAEEADWVLAFADAASGVATDAAAEYMVIVAGMLANLETALALLQDGLDIFAEQVEEIAPPLPSDSTSPSPKPSSTSSPSPLIPPGATAPIEDAIADAQSELDDLRTALEEVRDGVADAGGEYVEGANTAAGAALNGAFGAATWAQARAEELRAEIEDDAAATGAAGQEHADEAMADLDGALADLAWATDWLAAVQAFAPGLAGAAIADAQRAVDVANNTASDLVVLVQDYSPADASELADALAEQTAEAQQAIADVLDLLGDLPGLLEDAPMSVDDSEGLAICAAPAESQVCLAYRVADGGPGAVSVLVALPFGDPLLIDLPGSITSMTSSVTGLPTGLPTPTLPPLPTGLPASSSSSSSSSAAASSSSSSSSSSASGPVAHLVVEADRDALAMTMGEQAALTVTVHNDGDAADRVQLTAQSDAPITFDSPDEAMDIAPGESASFVVRVTPLEAGSGTLELLASGEHADTAKDSMPVTVAAAAPAAAKISASYEPSALQGAVGQSLAITVRLANDGPVADAVTVAVSGAGFSAEPARIDVDLAPGESALREVRVTPSQAGDLKVLLAISSSRGADLKPLVLLDAHDADLASDDAAGDDDAKAKGKDTPAIGLWAVLAAVGLAFVAVRRRLK